MNHPEFGLASKRSNVTRSLSVHLSNHSLCRPVVEMNVFMYVCSKSSLMTAQVSPALDDFAEFLAKLAPRKLLEYKASSKAQERLNFLLEKNKTAGLTQEEQDEMSYYMLIEHLVRLAKVRALKLLNREAL
jgi:hypothetical protein